MKKALLKLSYSLADLERVVQQFWEIAAPYSLIAFSGEMAAGKTTFIHKLCDYLGVTDVVSSPTFALINEYHFDDNGKDTIIYHMDWYRLKDTAEAISTGMEDCMIQAAKGNAYCFIEWPEKAQELIRQPHVMVSIAVNGAMERTITVELND